MLAQVLALGLIAVVLPACVRAQSTLAPAATSGASPNTSTPGPKDPLSWIWPEWRAACARLPLNRVLQGRLPPLSVLPLPKFGDLARLTDGFIAAARSGKLKTDTLWVGEPPSTRGFMNSDTPWFIAPSVPFEPFAQKLMLPPGSEVFVHGDLHGDVHSLNATLDHLNTTGRLDGWLIAQTNFHMVFLGDYTDRGAYGVEVIYALLRLKLANPDRVWLVRGNHEEAAMVAQYGFLAEARAKFGAALDPVRLCRIYDFMPVVLYLGCSTNFAQSNHGGMEPGYDPSKLLATSAPISFQLLGELRQGAYLNSNSAWPGESDSRRVAVGYLRDFRPESPTRPSVLGFMWNDFTVGLGEPQFQVDTGRAFVYGDRAARSILESASSAQARIRTVFRAHQHAATLNPMMQRLVASRGVFRHWQTGDSVPPKPGIEPQLETRIERTELRPVPAGSVWTFNVSPDSVYGLGCGYHFDTFGILRLEADFAGWRLQVVNIAVGAPVGGNPAKK